MPQKKQPQTTPAFNVTLKANDQEYSATDSTLPGAIEMIKLEEYKSKGVLIIENAGKKTEKLLYIPQMKRLFGSNKTAREVLSKYLLNGLK